MLGIAVHNEKRMVFMDIIVHELAEILKSEMDIIVKEKAVVNFFIQLVSFIFALALQQVDDRLVETQKAKGYHIEKKSTRTVITTFGAIEYCRRRYVNEAGEVAYPLDKLMGWDKYTRYSTLLVRNLGELATKLTYRSAAKAVELLSPITISHQKINQLVKQAGRHLKEQQTSDERYDELTTQKRTPKTLYIEGGGFQMSTVGNKRLEIHRFQICEGVCSAGKNRKERICARDFISTDRQLVVKEVVEYIENHWCCII